MRKAFEGLKRCGARARSNNGLPCKNIAMKNTERCYIHGGKSLVKHGYYSKRSKKERSEARSLLKKMKKEMNSFAEKLI